MLLILLPLLPTTAALFPPLPPPTSAERRADSEAAPTSEALALLPLAGATTAAVPRLETLVRVVVDVAEVAVVEGL